MTPTHWNRLAAGVLLLATACGGSQSHTTVPTPTPVAAPTPATPPAVATTAPVATASVDSPAPAPTATPAPAPTATPTPAATPTPPPDGTIGEGAPGTLGQGSGSGTGYGVPTGTGPMRGRSTVVPQVRIGQPTSVGDLDKAIIRRYIKRNIHKITYCYEKTLLTRPGLEGTVHTQFFISNTGAVVSSTASGVDNDVSTCIAAVIKAIEFPKPKGGGGVQVNYPFNFRPTGG